MNNTDPSGTFDAAVRLIAETDLDHHAIEALVAELGHQLGLEALQLDASGTVSLATDDETSITLGHQPGLPGLVASMPMPCDGPGRDQALRHLLQANASWAATGGGCFSILPGEFHPALFRRISLADGDIERVAGELTQFAQLGREWLQEIALFTDLFDQADDETGDEHGTAPGPPPAPPSGPGHSPDSGLIRV